MACTKNDFLLGNYGGSKLRNFHILVLQPENKGEFTQDGSKLERQYGRVGLCLFSFVCPIALIDSDVIGFALLNRR